jgi:16S rRNA (cytosine1402-N4)-methyltransferase
MVHVPVLPKQVLEYLSPKKNENFIDATIGEGGHATAILEKNKPGGRVLGIEVDKDIYRETKRRMAEFPISNFQFPNRFSSRLVLVNDSYANLKEIVEENSFGLADGILFDLGMSSWHLEESGRGFSFLKDEPLDMRFKTANNVLTAEKIINEWPQKELERIFREYGEERFSRRIAERICEKRKEKPIRTTFQLVEIIRKAAPLARRRKKIFRNPGGSGKRFAARAFQALRIAANDELNNFEKVLPQSMEVLDKGGRIVVISFHSIEDRIAKNFLKEESKKGLLKILTKKPITAGSGEIKLNPRARSAKLRAAIKL